jgi:hypothetical protein
VKGKQVLRLAAELLSVPLRAMAACLETQKNPVPVFETAFPASDKRRRHHRHLDDGNG